MILEIWCNIPYWIFENFNTSDNIEGIHIERSIKGEGDYLHGNSSAVLAISVLCFLLPLCFSCLCYASCCLYFSCSSSLTQSLSLLCAKEFSLWDTLIHDTRELQVDVVQACGGQKTADGDRFRSAGGVLWNIIKARDPNAYKEIMKKGKEFEVCTIFLISLPACIWSSFTWFFLWHKEKTSYVSQRSFISNPDLSLNLTSHTCWGAHIWHNRWIKPNQYYLLGSLPSQ